ncbi:MAG TPA: DUF6660 family protein, partial [Chitinophaga sp.]
MRCFAFIWSLLVIVMSCMPCGDITPLRTGAAIPVLTQDGDAHHPAQDNCSPFCQCNCCAGFSFRFQPVKITIAVIVPPRVSYSLYRIPAPQSLPLPI